MRAQRPPHLLLVVLPALFFAAGAVTLGVGFPTRRADAESSQKLVATGVCEAHELKARQAEDPHLEIEIPPEFDTPWPSAEACRSHRAAEDAEAPGPLQPIAFSHRHHAGTYGIDCLYCHSGTDRSPAAGVPSVAVCMGCHLQFPPSYDEMAGIRTLKEHWERQEPIQWAQVHRLPEHVQFRHNRHIQKGFECQACHGVVEQMDKVAVIRDTHWWPWLLPTQTLEMGWCVNCHRENGATQDCYACHH